jgi:ankyrin repeat protein
MVQRLVHVGADIHARDKDSLTPIYLACRKRNAVIARILLSAQPDLVAFCQKDVGVLHAAAFLGNNSLFQRLLNAALPLIEPPDADEDDDNVFAVLFFHPAVDLRRVFESGITLLHAAAFGGNVRIIQRVAELGGDVDRKEDSGVTPLHVAAYANNRLAVAKLVALGASVKKKDLEGRSAHSLAVGMGNHEAAEQLLIESDGRPLWGSRRRRPFPLD